MCAFEHCCSWLSVRSTVSAWQYFWFEISIASKHQAKWFCIFYLFFMHIFGIVKIFLTQYSSIEIPINVLTSAKVLHRIFTSIQYYCLLWLWTMEVWVYWFGKIIFSLCNHIISMWPLVALLIRSDQKPKHTNRSACIANICVCVQTVELKNRSFVLLVMRHHWTKWKRKKTISELTEIFGVHAVYSLEDRFLKIIFSRCSDQQQHWSTMNIYKLIVRVKCGCLRMLRVQFSSRILHFFFLSAISCSEKRT